ncbi:amino acid/amide ABC transporter ATP-binding protein 2, HAAT family [Paracoccus alcaliphilus]|uniref:Amino acid/amide ABC transporter ATP-binding protein 2, HAAT family n=1 Tax=Paracoccus alcaliphilus TaxID=34002 RepID=A0A1H8NDA9_9RHOB|nr:ABC transporter ATP-binding protein [Paracoccus alcaliphilus]WCR18608.1 ABC transporter ATP-binding protein [Paracoccus alcaliphilus]SEO27468.1 amino acid/amide ABC transporter ATP-binding protein 2, HAAT family [Paracoccus alcaliphilus]
MGLLQISDLHVHFGKAHILQGVSLELGAAPLSIVGRNGMGKTTLCQAIAGLVTAQKGEIRLNGRALRGTGPTTIARAGIALVPQGRRLFRSLTVHEHLRLVAQPGTPGDVAWTIERVYDTFPRLAERRQNRGNQLSGGEAQMVAIARALLMNPALVVMDEPSEGLAPVIVDHLIQVLRQIAAEGMGVLLIEQALHVATSVSDQVAVMVNGQLTQPMASAVLAGDPTAQQRWLGVGV